MIRLSQASSPFQVRFSSSFTAPHRPIAFSFHTSLLFLVNFFQDDTLGMEHNHMAIKRLTIFRVVDMQTLKMVNYL